MGIIIIRILVKIIITFSFLENFLTDSCLDAVSFYIVIWYGIQIDLKVIGRIGIQLKSDYRTTDSDYRVGANFETPKILSGDLYQQPFRR